MPGVAARGAGHLNPQPSKPCLICEAGVVFLGKRAVVGPFRELIRLLRSPLNSQRPERHQHVAGALLPECRCSGEWGRCGRCRAWLQSERMRRQWQ